MKRFIFIVAILVFALSTVVARASAQVNVTQEHNNPSRDGVYIDPAFTPSAAANLTRDLNFNGTISGNVYAQPLYIEGGPNGPMIIAVTESNNVYALNATTGLPIWSAHRYWSARPQATPCGDFNPAGITGTPVVDLASRSTFLRRIDQRRPHKTFHLFVERGHRRHQCGLAGGSERHRSFTTEFHSFLWRRNNAGDSLW